MKISTHVIWFTIIVAILVGGVTWWKLIPEHKREFYRNFARQIKYLPARYMA